MEKTHLNLSTRILMFSICTSLEFDLRSYISDSGAEINFSEKMIEKGVARGSKRPLPNEYASFLYELDLGDYIEIILAAPYSFSLNNEKARILETYFMRIIPIRNRVMHTRPLILGDRATLIEVLEKIPNDIPWLTWSETIKTKYTIENNPEKLIAQDYDRIIDYSSNISHNLPEPEFDDTGYIGRTADIKAIKDLIMDNKSQIITIVGNGGIGKTAIAVKTLYDLVDDVKNPFESIIWISLKTRTLSQGEFKNIKGAIQDVQSLFHTGEFLTVKENEKSPEENILNYMKAFNTLLVLDNLETISSEEILEFMREVPDNSKVLITSRHGLGELERRYKLDGLNQRDALLYFRELSQYYGLNLHRRSDNELKDLIDNHLYSSPLSIKWFISSIFSGVNETSIIANKENLIRFCMSNVVEKLTVEEKEILQLFLIEGQRLSYGEIDYFLEYPEENLIKFINTLISTSLLFIQRGEYELNHMAKDYLSIDYKPKNSFLEQVSLKRSRLNSILQDIKVKNEADPYSPKSLFKNLESKNRKLASFYLLKALEYSAQKDWESSYDYINKASSIAPDYFEVYKIKAFIAAGKGELFEAISNYRIALEACEEKFEEATILYLFSVFYTIKMQNFHEAEDLINKAMEIEPSEPIILLEKSRLLTYTGRYPEAELILSKLEEERESFSDKLDNQFISRYADLYRRMAQNYHMRDHVKKVELLTKAIETIETLKVIDSKTYVTMARILNDLSFLHINDEAMGLLQKCLTQHLSQLKSLSGNHFSKLHSNIIARSYEMEPELLESLKKLTKNYNKEAKNILESNKGLIVHIKDHYGFIANSIYPSLYFKLKHLNYTNYNIGDLVNFEVIDSPQGKVATNIFFEIKN